MAKKEEELVVLCEGKHKSDKIEILNLKDTKPYYPWDFIVDRTTALGNPFDMKGEGETRDMVCDRYKGYFKNRILTGERLDFHIELERISIAYRFFGKVRLFCWCSPKRCHAETIKEYLLLSVGAVKIKEDD